MANSHKKQKRRKKTRLTANPDDNHGSRGSNKTQPGRGRYRDQNQFLTGGCGREHSNRTTKK